MKKKSVAILTFHRAVNYGAVLQAYGLQTALNNLGFKADILDYRNDGVENYYYKTFKGKNLKGAVKSIVTHKTQKERNKKFIEFSKQYLNYSEKTYNRKTVIHSKDLYDYFIVGSDQMWNLPAIHYDKTYFLDFVTDNFKKKSYAISMGKISDCEKDYGDYYPLINDFDNISLRENAGKNFLEKNVSKDITIDLDPSFLLESSQWREISKSPQIDNYALIYSVNLTANVIETGRKYAKENGLKLVLVTLRNKEIPLQDNEFNLSCCSPTEFLGLVDNAKCVVTNSFHGTAFSVVLGTNFWTVKNSAQGLDNSRMETLLNTFNLSDRHISAPDEATDILTDFSKAEEILSKLRNKSISNLIDSLNK